MPRSSTAFPALSAAIPPARPQLRRVTQKDIAALVGVHNTTVSLALRHDPSIPETTRQRILNVAQELGYRPDPALSALVSYRRSLDPKRRKSTIAYATGGDSRWAWQDDPTEARYFEGAQQAANDRGLQLEHFWLDEPQLSPKRLNEILYNRGISGMVLSAANPRLHPFIDFVSRRLQVISLGSGTAHPPGNAVTSDWIGDVRRAVRRVLRAGYRRPALVIGDPASGARDHASWLGFVTEQSRDVGQSREMIFRAHFQHAAPPGREGASRADAFARWLDETKPDALIGSAGFVRDLLSGTAKRIPHDLGLVDPHLTDSLVNTTGMRQQPERVGQVAIEMLYPRLGRDPRSCDPSHTTTLIEGLWIPGATLPHTASTQLRPRLLTHR